MQKEVLVELAKEQRPYATIIGCSDSRVPPEQEVWAQATRAVAPPKGRPEAAMLLLPALNEMLLRSCALFAYVANHRCAQMPAVLASCLLRRHGSAGRTAALLGIRLLLHAYRA